MKYKCSICGKKHNYYFGLEVPIHSGMFDEKASRLIDESRIVSYENVRIVDNKTIYINAPVRFRVNDLNAEVQWLIWAEVEFELFWKFADQIQKIGYGQIPVQLDHKFIPYVDDDKTIFVTYVMDNDGSFSFQFSEEDTKYYYYQKRGMQSEDLQRMMNRINHPEIK